eukprot:gene5616-6307_t
MLKDSKIFSQDHSTYIYGVRYPNRIFVGGLTKETSASQIAQYFSRYGKVTESKVMLNEDTSSKGYGFITFSSAVEVESVFKQGTLFFKGRKLNIGPAIRKQAPETPGEVVYLMNQTLPVLPPSPPPIHPLPLFPYMFGVPPPEQNNWVSSSSLQTFDKINSCCKTAISTALNT